MPVDCRFQIYPWKDPNDPSYQEYNGIDGNGRLNYLLYLEMTGNNDGSIPEVGQEGRFLTEVGNWTDGRNPGAGKDPSSQFGTFILTHQKLLEEFLLPKFDKMNRSVKTDLSGLKAEVHTKGFYSYFKRDVRIEIGAGVATGFEPMDANYPFTRDQSLDNIMRFMPSSLVFPTRLPSNALTWYWQFKDEPMSQHNPDRYLGFMYNAEHWGQAASMCIPDCIESYSHLL